LFTIPIYNNIHEQAIIICEPVLALRLALLILVLVTLWEVITTIS